MAGDGVIPLVHLDSIDEVRAVHKMLFDRKFDGQEDVYFGSPFVASVQHKLLDAGCGGAGQELGRLA
ncbi:hypothetical protein AQI95_40920 [Streptomyces yokosukanensis]|uniref:Uncharacterized protein n=1 Tax=Streptomyces yokosukanensis TaxID=67386 RepID=A0A101NTV2_9ACTN|nr:hypothetical protein [Streptomyces yokosukanensis]KUM99072.1 hypothetical protein AQI95_40920 [Streptomyces yokosukanensis]